MITKQEIVGNWLVRYTKMPLEAFGQHILLTNFNNYIDLFCDEMNVPHVGFEANMRAVTAGDITMINFGIGSPNAALIMDLLSCVNPKACLFWASVAAFPTRHISAITSCPWQASVAKERQTIIFRQRCRRFRRLCFSVPFPPLCETIVMIIGRVRSIRPTAVSGNMMNASRVISAKRGLWLSTWRRQRSFLVDSITTFRQGRSCSCRTIRWTPTVSKRRPATRR